MSTLPDDIYDAFIIDANIDDDVNIVRLELTITSGAYKGDVVAVRAENLWCDAVDLLGLPAKLRVRDGAPTVTFD